MEKKVLIITYYWPPSGGSGVQRWLKFVKYLPGLGWEPFVFTPENPSFGMKDESLLHDVPPEAEVVRFPIWEPYEAFGKMSSMFGEKKSGGSTVATGKERTLFQQITTWIRGNIFIPDPRVFWVRPSVKFLDDFLKEKNIRTIITTGPPHSVHLIGYHLKKKNQSLKWIADFRDPWSEWGFLDSLSVGALARSMHRRLESKVLRTANHIVTITPFYVRRFESLSGRKVDLLSNGYDEDDFKYLTIQLQKKFVIRHAGIINEKCDPRPFMTAIKELTEANDSLASDIQLDFVGDVHPQFIAFVKSSATLSSITTFTPPVPHRDLIALYGKASVLLIVLTGYKDAEGYMPGKLFEYLATGLPILGTGPENGDAAALLNQTGAGFMLDGSNSSLIKDKLLSYYEDWRKGRTTRRANLSEGYSRKAITKNLTELL